MLDASQAPFPALPDDVLRLVAAKLVALLVGGIERTSRHACAEEVRGACSTLSAASRACSALRQGLVGGVGGRSIPWRRLLEATSKHGPEEGEDELGFQRARGYRGKDRRGIRWADVGTAVGLVRAGTLEARRACLLVCTQGCQICRAEHAANVRKVYWPFHVRCCVACLQESTVSDWELNKSLGVPQAALAARGVRSRVAGIHGRPSSPSSLALRYYWREDPALVRAVSEILGLLPAPADLAAAEAAVRRRREEAEDDAARLATEASLRDLEAAEALHESVRAVAAGRSESDPWMLTVLSDHAATPALLRQRSDSFARAYRRVVHRDRWATRSAEEALSQVLRRWAGEAAAAAVTSAYRARSCPALPPLSDFHSSEAASRLACVLADGAVRSRPPWANPDVAEAIRAVEDLFQQAEARALASASTRKGGKSPPRTPGKARVGMSM